MQPGYLLRYRMQNLLNFESDKRMIMHGKGKETAESCTAVANLVSNYSPPRL
jgi:hypothetical protein